MTEDQVNDALKMAKLLTELKLPKNTILKGTEFGMEVHPPDKTPYLIRPL